MKIEELYKQALDTFFSVDTRKTEAERNQGKSIFFKNAIYSCIASLNLYVKRM